MPKNVLLPIRLLEAAVLTDDVTSAPVKVSFLDNISIQINLTGAPAGAFSVQVSNDVSWNPDGSLRNPGEWTTLTTPPSITVTAGSPDPIFIDVNQTGANGIRLIWVDNASPSGTATAILMAKGI